ncbi:Trm112 family protein [Aliiglaciecola sp.]|nr:Trm112 family protein [Aliiglaciecola sp.]
MAFDKKLLDILACPICKGKVQYQQSTSEIICRFDRLAFPIKDNIPVMLENEARELTLEDLESMDK